MEKMEKILTSLPKETYNSIKSLSEEYSVSMSSIVRMFCIECLRSEVLGEYDFGILDGGQENGKVNRKNGQKKK